MNPENLEMAAHEDISGLYGDWILHPETSPTLDQSIRAQKLNESSSSADSGYFSGPADQSKQSSPSPRLYPQPPDVHTLVTHFGDTFSGVSLPEHFRLPTVLLQHFPTLGNEWDALPNISDEGYDGDISRQSSSNAATIFDDYISGVNDLQPVWPSDEGFSSGTLIFVNENAKSDAQASSQELENPSPSASSNATGNTVLGPDHEKKNVYNVQHEGEEHGSHSGLSLDDNHEHSPEIHDVPLQVSSDHEEAWVNGVALENSQKKEMLPGKFGKAINVKACDKSAPKPPSPSPNSDRSCSAPAYENCPTPSTILDEDMTDLEDELSESETLLSSTVSSASMWLGSPRSAEREAIVTPILDESRRQIVDRLMVEVRLLLNGQIGIRSRADSTESPRSGSVQNDTSGTQGGSSKNNLKRFRNSDGGSETPGDEAGDDTPNKRLKIDDPDADDKPRRLACPYYKRSSRSHRRYRSCAGPGWSTCHRVKEHIYRRHKLPVSCMRCCTAFSNDKELSDHLRQVESCQIRRAEAVEGLDKVQEAQLRSRKKLSGTEEQRWKEMYMVLFPDDDEDMVPSPYYENDSELNGQSDELAEYDRFMARELPRLVRTQLEATVMGASGSLERQIQSQLVDIVRNCQRELFRSYAGTRQPQGLIPGANPRLSSDETAPPDMPPADGIGDINAVFAPPSLLDTNLLFSYEELMQNSIPMCPPELATFSDSAYGSQNQNTTFIDGLDALGQINANEPQQFADGVNIISELPNSQSFRTDLLENDSFRLSSAEPWSSLAKQGWFPQE